MIVAEKGLGGHTRMELQVFKYSYCCCEPSLEQMSAHGRPEAHG